MRWQYHAPSQGLPVPLTRGNPPSVSFQVHDSIATPVQLTLQTTCLVIHWPNKRGTRRIYG